MDDRRVGDETGLQKPMNGRRLLPGKPIPLSQTPDYSIRRDTLDEVFAEGFRLRLERIAELVKQSGERLEGNIFFGDLKDHYVDEPPDPDLAPARRNVWRAVRFKERLLEVGVNAGHSALLALSSNPRLEYYGVDIMSHPYTEPCVDFLKGEFPGRVHLFTGDSREVLPWLVSRRAELAFDVFHVDGGHTDEVCRSDMGNCIRIASGGRGRHVLLDDVHASWIFDVYCEFVSRGDLTTETFFGDWEEAGRNVLARIE
jgi:Methyltransferase domain